VVAWCDLANHPGQAEPLVQVAVPRGGLLLKTQRVTATRFDFLIGLPRTLHTGQSHRYQLALTVPCGDGREPAGTIRRPVPGGNHTPTTQLAPHR
jgi:hypothetical protein